MIACRAGTFAVEFALITPIFLILLLTGFDISMGIFRKMELETAAKAAIQYGMLRKPVQGDLTAIRNAAVTNLPAEWFTQGAPAPATVTADLTCQCPNSGEIACNVNCPGGEFRSTYLNVRITKVHQPLFDYPWLDANFTLTTISSVRLQ